MATPPTNVADEALKKVQDQLECSICLQPYTEPKLLLCFHVYCKHCLNQMVVKSRDQSTVTCPQCRQTTPLPQSGVTSLQGAFHIHRLFEIRETLEKLKEPEKVHCDNKQCNKATATGYCRECGKFVCEECVMAHKRLELVASHQIVSISDVQVETANLVPPKTKPVMTCPRHSENPLKIYCENCQELICVDCTIRLHKDHQYDLVTDVFPTHRDEIVTQLEPLKQHLQTVNEARIKLKSRRNEIVEQRQAIEADFHRRLDQLHQALEQRRAEGVVQLEQRTGQKMKNLAAQDDQVEMLHAQLSSCLEYVEGSLRTGTEGEILAMKAPVISQFQKMVPDLNPNTLQPCEMADTVFIEDDAPRLTEACSTFGVITSVDPAQYYTTGNGLRVAQVGDRGEVTLHTRSKDGKQCFVSAAHVTAELVCVEDKTKVKGDVTERENTKHLITFQPTRRGKHHLHIMIGGKHTRDSPHTVVVQPRLADLGTPVKVVHGMIGPRGVTSNSKGMMIVSEHGANCVSVYTPKGEKMQTIGSSGQKKGQFNCPTGITIDGNDNIYIVDCDNHRIQKFTPKAEHISSVGSKGNDKLQFVYPVGIWFNPTNNKLYVCDQNNHRIQVLNTDLTFSTAFGTRGEANGQFQHPLGVAFDDEGNMYITDCRNHRVQVFTSEGQYLRQFGTKGSGRGQLSCPYGIAIDKERVYVTERDNHRVSIFTTAGQFLHSFGTEGQEPGQLNEPRGVTVDNNGYILVADCENNRMQFF